MPPYIVMFCDFLGGFLGDYIIFYIFGKDSTYYTF